MKLTDREWNVFILEDVFYIQSTGSGIDKNKLDKENGKIPYITRTDRNNGLESFICEQKNKKYKIDNGNVITIGLDTQTAFYQPTKFYTGQNIQILSNHKLNCYSAMFIIPILKQLMKKFSWGSNGATLTRLKRSRICLPINEKKQLDWEFMEKYILEKEQKVIDRYNKDIIRELDKCNVVLDKTKQTKIQYKTFMIQDLFDVKIGKCIDGNKIDKQNGKNAYITRKENNNGLDGFIDFDENYLNKEFPVITIGNETAQPYVQVYPFFTGTKVNILKPKFNMNKYVLFFICQALLINKNKYSYSFTINSTRLKKQNIILPVKKNEEIDILYMENYIKNMIYKKIEKYIKYRKV